MLNSRKLHLQALIIAVLLIGVIGYGAVKWVWRMIG